jgi:enoyl-CoA hydratase/carnithine racemase
VTSLAREGDVFVLTLGAGENRFDDALMSALEETLDTVEASDGPAALVTTGEGKFFSNGLDLAWLMGPGSGQGERFVARMQALFARWLTSGVPTVAALGGHAFAAGAMFAFAHDYRVMREDRGFLCVNEVDLATGQPITEGMAALIGCRLPPATFHEMVLTGRRYGGPDAVAAGASHECVAAERLLPRAVDLAGGLAGKHRPTVRANKERLFEAVTKALRAPVRL